jgi:predicted MPP superfamily phosphohydrolase
MEAPDDSKLRVYWASDIHLELRIKPPKKILEAIIGRDEELSPESAANRILCLAGDIGNPFKALYKIFLTVCKQRFAHVFVVSGNHEYYSAKDRHTMDEVDAKIDDVCAEVGAHFLTGGDGTGHSVTLFHNRPIKFVGCTLWTEADSRAETIMRDYQYIYCKEGAVTYNGLDIFADSVRRITSYDVLAIHRDQKEYLAREIEKSRHDGITTVVVTHHAPTLKMLRPVIRFDYDSDENEHAAETSDLAAEKIYGISARYYATALDDMISPPVVLWVSGHTHDSKTVMVNGVQCSSNCYGYPTQTAAETGFSSQVFVI